MHSQIHIICFKIQRDSRAFSEERLALLDMQPYGKQSKHRAKSPARELCNGHESCVYCARHSLRIGGHMHSSSKKSSESTWQQQVRISCKLDNFARHIRQESRNQPFS